MTTEVYKKFSDDYLEIVVDTRTTNGTVRFDTSKGSTTILANPNPEFLHALADWIIANVPKPEPKTAWDHWLDFEVGQVFTIGRSGNNYRKISATEAVYLGDKETYKIDPDMRTTWSPQKYDFLSEVVLPIPTKFAAVVKTRAGTHYTLTTGGWFSSHGGSASEGYLRDHDFEVIFEGVDD